MLAQGRGKGHEAEDGHADGEEAEGERRDDGGLFGEGELKMVDDHDGKPHDGGVDEDVQGADCVPKSDLHGKKLISRGIRIAHLDCVLTDLVEAFSRFISPCMRKIALEDTRYDSTDSPDYDEACYCEDGPAMANEAREPKEQDQS